MLLFLGVIGVALSLAAIWKIGAWNLVFPNTSHDTVAPAIPASLATPAVLVFSKTNGFRHVEGIAGGAKALESIASTHKWGMFHTENGAVFNERDLARFDVVVFLNASGDMLSDEQESAFQSWLTAGGGWLGIHAAGDSSHLDWQWYRDNLIGATFTAHIMGPQFQTATVVLENHDHPALQGLPNVWQHEEEWYSWEKSPRVEGFKVLATLDENSYVPVADFMGTKTDLSMGDHPVVWTNCIGAGKSIYAAMGHRAEAFEQPQIRLLLENALTWLIDTRGEACAPQ
ncbi:MAG: ThuA domain-containing protein [Halioglobus sp.]|nr:ThuA domain-containing protein [Halioglobus sp.]